MKRYFFFVMIACAICFCAMTSQAQAQASRTWVSGVGDDANPCSRTAPCKTWAGAVSKTADCGEMDALDPGGFGAVTLTKGVKLDGGGGEAGQVASISPQSAVRETAPGQVLHGAVRLHGFASSPRPDTHVRVACACACDVIAQKQIAHATMTKK